MTLKLILSTIVIAFSLFNIHSQAWQAILVGNIINDTAVVSNDMLMPVLEPNSGFSNYKLNDDQHIINPIVINFPFFCDFINVPMANNASISMSLGDVLIFWGVASELINKFVPPIKGEVIK